MIRERHEEKLTTADLATAAERPPERGLVRDEKRTDLPQGADSDAAVEREEQALAPLFPQEVAADFRAQWDAIQIGFVDDPRNAVQRADELVAQVMKRLAETFSRERAALEKQLGKNDTASTENLRVALRGYRSFFKRLLSL
jgi:hypothetical protein